MLTEQKRCFDCWNYFLNDELVYYTWYEGRALCSNCKRKLEELIDADYLDWQQQIVKGGK